MFRNTFRKCIARYMINPRISTVCSTIKPIAPFSCTPEVVNLTPGLLGLGVLFNCHAKEMYCETYE